MPLDERRFFVPLSEPVPGTSAVPGTISALWPRAKERLIAALEMMLARSGTAVLCPSFLCARVAG
jgi:hypothetical protein